MPWKNVCISLKSSEYTFVFVHIKSTHLYVCPFISVVSAWSLARK